MINGKSRTWLWWGVALVFLCAAAWFSHSLLQRGVIRLNYPARFAYPVRGVDISHHQGEVDWKRMSREGIHFAYIKASEGATFRDDQFASNWSDATQAGMVPGAYHFYSLCVAPDLQAANFLAAAPPSTRATLPPAVDLEFGGNCRSRPGVLRFRTDLSRFLHQVEAAWGRPATLYVTPDFYPEYLEGSFESNPLWVRSIVGPPEFAGFSGWRFWQYANKGQIAGTSGHVDLNVYAGSPEEFEVFTRARPVPEK